MDRKCRRWCENIFDRQAIRLTRTAPGPRTHIPRHDQRWICLRRQTALKTTKPIHKQGTCSESSLCNLCVLSVEFLLGIHQPQRHRGHRDCTEKSATETLCKALVP